MKSIFEEMGGTYTLGADGMYYPEKFLLWGFVFIFIQSPSPLQTVQLQEHHKAALYR